MPLGGSRARIAPEDHLVHGRGLQTVAPLLHALRDHRQETWSLSTCGSDPLQVGQEDPGDVIADAEAVRPSPQHGAHRTRDPAAIRAHVPLRVGCPLAAHLIKQGEGGVHGRRAATQGRGSGTDGDTSRSEACGTQHGGNRRPGPAQNPTAGTRDRRRERGWSELEGKARGTAAGAAGRDDSNRFYYTHAPPRAAHPTLHTTASNGPRGRLRYWAWLP